MLHQIAQPVQLRAHCHLRMFELEQVVVYLQVYLFHAEVVIVKAFEDADSDCLGLATALDIGFEIAAHDR